MARRRPKAGEQPSAPQPAPAAPTPVAPPPATTPGWPALLVAAAALLAYANTLGNRPVLDDGWVIFDNYLIKDLRRVPEIFTAPYNAAGGSTTAGLYRPLTTLSYALDWAVHGAEPAGFHLVNLALHAACALLVLRLSRLLAAALARRRPLPLPAEAIALPAALLFALHPVHVEAVAGLVGRAELIAALGALGALLLACTRERGRWRLPAAIAAVALGALGKESAACTALLFGLIGLLLPEAAGLGGPPGLRAPEARRRLLRLAGLCGLLALGALPYLTLKLAANGSLGVPVHARHFGDEPLSTVLWTMTRALAEEWRVLAFPRVLGLDFYYRTLIPLARGPGAEGLAATAVWASLLAVALAVRRLQPLAALGLLWVFAALTPVLNLIPIGTLMAERLLYLPSAGFCLAAGALLAAAAGALRGRLGDRGALRALAALWLLLLAACAARTVLRNRDWADNTALYTAELRLVPDDPVMNNNLAVELNSRGQFDRAIPLLQRALRADPGYWRALINLGIAHHARRADAEALGAYAQAARLAPWEDAPPFFTGVLLLDGGNAAQALRSFEEAARLAPRRSRNFVWLARCLLLLGRRDEARARVREALALDPQGAEALTVQQEIR